MCSTDKTTTEIVFRCCKYVYPQVFSIYLSPEKKSHISFGEQWLQLEIWQQFCIPWTYKVMHIDWESVPAEAVNFSTSIHDQFYDIKG